MTASNYADFLNAVAATDGYQLYDERMGLEANAASILRTGKPGNYHYEAIEGKENCTVAYLNLFEVICYLGWLQHHFESTAQTYFLNEEKIKTFRKDDDFFTPWSITACYPSLDSQLKSNQNGFQIKDASEESVLKSGINLAADGSLGEILEEGALAILALAAAGGGERAPEVRREGAQGVIPVEERQVEAVEEARPVIEVPQDVLNLSPRKASPELIRKVFAVFLDHYYKLALVERYMPLISTWDRQEVRSAIERFARNIEKYEEYSSDVINYRMLPVIDRLEEITRLTIAKNSTWNEDRRSNYIEAINNATKAINYFNQSAECSIKFSEAKVAGNELLARALAHATAYYEKAVDNLIKGKHSYFPEHVAAQLAKAEEKFAKADRKIATYQTQEAGLAENQEIIRNNFVRYDELITESATKFKQALAAANLPEAFNRWNAGKAVETALEYRKKAIQTSSEKNQELADLSIEAFGYFWEAAERFTAAQKVFAIGDKENAHRLGSQGILFETAASGLKEAISYGEKAGQYVNETIKAKRANKDEAAIRNWMSIQYQKAIQPKVSSVREAFSNGLTDNEGSSNRSDLFLDDSLLRDEEENHNDYSIEWIENACGILNTGPGKPGYPLFQKALPSLKNALKYHHEATKSNSSVTEEEKKSWSQAAHHADKAVKGFLDAGTVKLSNASAGQTYSRSVHGYRLAEPGEDSDTPRKTAMKAAKKASQCAQEAESLREKNKTKTDSTNLPNGISAVVTESTAQQPAEAVVEVNPNPEKGAFTSIEAEQLAVIESKEQEGSTHLTDAVAERLARLQADLPTFSEKANNIASPGAKLWKQVIDQTNTAKRHLEKATKVPGSEKGMRLREAANKVMDAVDYLIQAAELKQRAAETCASGNLPESQRHSQAAKTAANAAQEAIQAARSLR